MSDERISDRDERVRILREKAEREGLEIPDEVIDYIADKATMAQTLKSALVRVATMSVVRRVPCDLGFARSVLGTPEELAEAQEAQEALEAGQNAHLADEDVLADETLFASEPEPEPGREALRTTSFAPAGAPASAPAAPPASAGPARATVWFAPVRTATKESLIKRAGRLLERAGLRGAIAEGDLVAIKLHFGEAGNTGFVQPMYLREVVARVREAGGKPFLTDSNTLYRGARSNAVDHIECAIHNGFGFATVEAPVVIADGIDGRDAVDVPIQGKHFTEVRIGAAAVHADAMVVVTHVKGHEAAGFGGAIKNVGMGLGCRSAKQRMHSDFSPDVVAEKCTACGRCVKWCPVGAMAIGPDRVAEVDYGPCYGCGECVAACPEGAIAIQWKTEAADLQEKMVEHAAGALAGKGGKTVYLSFLLDISPDCDCWHFSDTGIVADIGVLASTDIVAIDRAAYDLVTRARGLPGTRGEGLEAGMDKFKAITGVDGTAAIRHAERMGLGTHNYDLRTLE